MFQSGKIFFCVFIYAFLGFSLADTINVPADSSSIQSAINGAANGDTVLVAPGTYYENINFSGKAITVASYFILEQDTSFISQTIIDGSQPLNPDSASVVTFNSGEDTTSVLTGFVITGGTGTNIAGEMNGGGILLLDAGAKIVHNNIKENSVTAETTSGGGIAVENRSGDDFFAVIENNIISNNSANGSGFTVGGGISFSMNGRFNNNIVEDNKAQSNGTAIGGGIAIGQPYEHTVKVEFNGNLISGNRLTSLEYIAAGAGVYHWSDYALISDNTITNNIFVTPFAGYGAGMYVVETKAGSKNSIKNNIVKNNSDKNSGVYGGGICVDYCFDLEIDNNRLENNTAEWGGAFFVSAAPATMRNNLIIKNSAKYGAGLFIQYTETAAQTSLTSISDINRIKNYRVFDNSNLPSLEKASAAENSIGIDLINNTIAENIGQTGGAISSASSRVNLLNSILWENGPMPVDGLINAQYSNIQGGYEGMSNIQADPLFVDHTDYFLSESSPCVDSGHPDSSYADQEDPDNQGFAMFPALGELRNDIGYTGGNSQMLFRGGLLGLQFSAFVKRVENADYTERSAIVDSFMNAQASFPVIEQENVVYFLYRGNTSRVNVPGDFNGWDMQANSMTKLSTTNLWYNEAFFEADARLDYKFVLGGSNWILDPLNDNTILGGFGPNNELAMPKFVNPVEINYYADIAHGTIEQFNFTSTSLNNTRPIKVYKPPVYEAAASDTFPVILFHDGQDYLSFANAKNILDYLIANQRIDPVVAVFVPPVEREQEYAFSKVPQFETFIIEELMPHIDSTYRVFKNPAKRAMTGPSYGGRITTTICYNHPEVFGLAAPISGSIYANVNESPVTTGPKKELRWYIDWGSYENGPYHRQVKDALIDIGYEVAWNEWHDGHSWGNWRGHLDNVLENFFPGSAVGIADNETFVLPERIALYQNYPNPFNPLTTIVYALPQSADVSIKIYNALGQEVRTLLNTNQTAGVKKVIWDGKDNFGKMLASAIYLYRLQADSFVQTRKMILLK